MTKSLSPATLTIAQRIDARCDHFETEWRAGRRPRIEDYVAAAPEADRPDLFRALLAVELELQFAQEQKPEQGAYEQRFPQQAVSVAAVFQDVRASLQSVQERGSGETSLARPRVAASTTGPFQGDAAAGAVPRQIGRFEVLSLLGEGAFGKVYKARDPQLDREVAIKVPQPGAQEKASDVERFLREAKAAANIRHPNICPVYEVGKDGDVNYIVMAFVPGQSLAANIGNRREPMPQRQAALVVRKLALALETAHAKGIIHRDLKPTNIMFDRDRKDVVVMDFGLARQVRKDEAQLTQSGVIMGTPSYMPPEQACGEVNAIGPWSDVYALGVIFYEMLTGRRPFNGSVAEVIGKLLHVEPEPPSKHRPDLDPNLEAICLKAMAKDPQRRYRSMKELAAALNDYTKAAIPEAKPVTPSMTAPGTEMQHFAQMVQALSAERKAETAAAVERAVARARLPLWKVLVGCAFLGAVLLAGILFFARTPTATVTIVLEGIDLKDGSLSFSLDGKGVSAAELEKPIELKVGDHMLLVKRGQALLKEFRFVVRGGGEPGIEIREVINREPEKVPPPTQQNLPPPAAEGFESLFNGKDLSGWQPGLGNNAKWAVQDRILVGSGPPGHLFSDRGDFQDFHLRVEAQINDGGNSGVYFRSPLGPGFPDAYEAQINSTARDPIKTGSLFPRFNPNLSDAQKEKILVLVAPVKPDEWFTQEIIAQGNRIIIKVNGKVTVDFVDENNTYRRGHFALQQHHDGSIVRFRKIEIKELKTAAAVEDGFTPLFNGKDLTGWDGLTGYWTFANDELVGKFPPGPGAHTFLCSKKKYGDFELRFDAKMVGAMGNSGVQFRSVIKDANRLTTFGPQVEITDWASNYGPGSLVTEPAGAPGVRSDWLAVQKVLKAGDWNSYALRVTGKHVTITVNGLTTVNEEFNTMAADGIIAWQIHGNMKDKEVRFRNIRIKATDPGPKCAAATPTPKLDNNKDHESFVETAKKGGIDVLFLGDSITAGWRGAAKVWAQHFEPLKAAHFGIGGDRTQHLLWRILNGELEGIQPKVAVVMIGTNNSSSDTAADIAEGIEAIVTTIREKSPRTKVLLVAIFPRGNPLPNPQNDRLTEVNKLIAKLDNGSTVRFMHVNARFLDTDGQIARELMPDFLHLSPQGYEIWAAAMMPLLNEMLAEETAAWQPLFNGKDLAGWQGLAPYWKVVDGNIVGSSPGIAFNTCLCSTKKYKDFELRFQVRLTDEAGNSGVQIRSVVFDPSRQLVMGPQCDIGIPHWGSLYGERFAGRPYIAGQAQMGSMMKAADAAAQARAHKRNEFNDYFIRCVGKHVTIKLNGETTVDGDFPQMYDDGVIAWQIHAGAPMEVTFRKVEIKEIK